MSYYPNKWISLDEFEAFKRFDEDFSNSFKASYDQYLDDEIGDLDEENDTDWP